MRLKPVVPSIAALGLCTGCLFSTDPQDLLLGTWDWVSSRYSETLSGAPVTITPASAGYTRTLAFYTDGFVEEYRNDSLQQRTTYRIDRIEYSNGTRSEPRLFIGEFVRAQFSVTNDSLLISTAEVDGPEERFVRRR